MIGTPICSTRLVVVSSSLQSITTGSSASFYVNSLKCYPEEISRQRRSDGQAKKVSIVL